MSGTLSECRDGAGGALDRTALVRDFRQQRPCKPARPRPDLDYGDPVERSGGACDTTGQVEIEQEILAERPLGRQTVPPDHLTQWRQLVDCAHRLALYAGGS